MKKPVVVSPGEEVTQVGEVFSTPLVVKGTTWFPLVELVAWPLMAWLAKKRIPDRSWLECLGIGALSSSIALGSEWGHNLAHAAAAQLIGKPMDVIRITWGMPLLVYHDINDEEVTPKQHIARALGGPLFNLILLPFALVARKHSQPESGAWDVANVASVTNTFIPTVGLLPIPGLDGGPILKWSLVQKGSSIPAADQTVRRVNGVVGAALGIGSVVSFKNKRRLIGGLLAMLSATALAIFSGLLKEQG